MPPRLLLVGAGHAHLEILRRLGSSAHPPVHPILVSETKRQLYSGMVPGYLYGAYREAEVTAELAPLVARAGGETVRAQARGLDPKRRRVVLAGGRELEYDRVSFNVGSRIAGEDVPGVREHAALIKPIERAVEVRRRIEELAGRAAGTAHAVVVGAGAAGIEVACALATALDRRGVERRVVVVEAGPDILAGYSRRFRDAARKVLAGRRIELSTRSRVAAVRADEVELADGSRVASELTVWLAGAAAPPLFQGSGLALDARGFLLVDRWLRAPAAPEVFGAGDCATLIERPETPKAGVYAVKQAPVLWRSLMASLGASGKRPGYEPQQGFLSILNTADGKALLRYEGVVSHSRWAWWLKDRIDRRFLARYQIRTAGR